MKFIFPQNYNFKNKILGIIDYTTAFVNITWFTFILLLVNILFNSINIKIFIVIVFCFPLLIFSIVGFNGENIFTVLKYMFKFFFTQKLFLFSKKRKMY